MFRESVARALPDPPAADTEFAADAQVVLAAIRRMELALRGERTPSAMEQLREPLAEMWRALAEAKSAIKPDAAPTGKLAQVTMLLYQVESRIDEMMTLAGMIEPDDAADSPPAPGPETLAAPVPLLVKPVEAVPPTGEDAFVVYPSEEFADHELPEEDRVPTVSEVVSRLSRHGEPGPPETEPHTEAAEDISGEGLPSLPVLEAMVEALISSAEAAEARNLADWAADAAIDPARVREQAAEPVLEPEPEPLPDPAPEQPPARAAVLPQVDLLPELDLLSSFAQMRAIPHPPELGTAVIFPPRSPADAPAVEANAEPAAAPEPQPAETPAVIALPAAPVLLLPPPPLRVVVQQLVVEPPEPAPPQLQPPAEMPPAETASAADVLGVVLETPDLDPEPAVSLLEPPSPIAAAPAAPAPLAATAAEPPGPFQPHVISTTPIDPLRPLRSMSDDEKIALFS
jgi:hypothetical protein